MELPPLANESRPFNTSRQKSLKLKLKRDGSKAQVILATACSLISFSHQKVSTSACYSSTFWKIMSIYRCVRIRTVFWFSVMCHSLGRRRTYMIFTLTKVWHYQKQLLCLCILKGVPFFSLWILWPRGQLFTVVLIKSVFSILTQIIFFGCLSSWPYSLLQ